MGGSKISSKARPRGPESTPRAQKRGPRAIPDDSRVGKHSTTKTTNESKRQARQESIIGDVLFARPTLRRVLLDHPETNRLPLPDLLLKFLPTGPISRLFLLNVLLKELPVFERSHSTSSHDENRRVFLIWPILRAVLQYL